MQQHWKTVVAGAAAAAFLLAMRPLDLDADVRELVETYTKRVQPLEKEVALSDWEAKTTGSKEAFGRFETAQKELDAALSDAAFFKQVQKLRSAGAKPSDPLLARQLEVIHLACLPKQQAPELLKKMVELSTSIEQAFNTYRGKIDGKEITENEVRRILKESNDTAERKKAWEASKGVGREVVGAGFKELIQLRNQAARRLEFENYYVMSLAANEQEEGALLQLFEELEQLTDKPFRQLKAEIDERLGKRYGVEPGDLQAWHYHDPFFQEAPKVFDVDLDAIYQKVDVLKVCRSFYAGIGLPIDRILERSDLHEKPGKVAHAFCFDIDREGDIRVLANIQPNDYWMATMLHELGHAVYDDGIERKLPFALRAAAHTLTTEGIAMMFGRLSKHGAWMRQAAGVPEETVRSAAPGAARMLRAEALVFSRWCQVMLHFERGMYRDPDQDLGKLWWDLVERYQGVRRPGGRNEPDYASKIHIVSAPVYYHNYEMGDLFASQVHRSLVRALHGDKDPKGIVYVRDQKVGKFLRERVFAPGARLSWNELTRFATSEPLSPRAFAADFLQ